MARPKKRAVPADEPAAPVKTKRSRVAANTSIPLKPNEAQPVEIEADGRVVISDEDLAKEVGKLIGNKERAELVILSLMDTYSFDFHYLVELLQRKLT